MGDASDVESRRAIGLAGAVYGLLLPDTESPEAAAGAADEFDMAPPAGVLALSEADVAALFAVFIESPLPLSAFMPWPPLSALFSAGG